MEISSEIYIYFLKNLINSVQISVWSVLWLGFNEIVSYVFSLFSSAKIKCK